MAMYQVSLDLMGSGRIMLQSATERDGTLQHPNEAIELTGEELLFVQNDWGSAIFTPALIAGFLQGVSALLKPRSGREWCNFASESLEVPHLIDEETKAFFSVVESLTAKFREAGRKAGIRARQNWPVEPEQEDAELVRERLKKTKDT